MASKSSKEKAQVPLYTSYNNDANVIEVGMDEAGRGSLIGPVFTAAVIWPPNLTTEINPLVAKIKDSKKMTKKQRENIRVFIEENAIDFAVAYADADEIDQFNILQATYRCMHRALDKLKSKFDMIIVDGNNFKPYMHTEHGFIPHVSVIDGDNQYVSIAAASILAKVYHDECINKLCCNDPTLDTRYGLLKNMGYGTKTHIDGIKEHGITQWHRRSFKTCK